MVIRDTPDADFAGYPANLKTGYRIYCKVRQFGEAGYRISDWLFNSLFKCLITILNKQITQM
jgi:hypothetical protein